LRLRRILKPVKYATRRLSFEVSISLITFYHATVTAELDLYILTVNQHTTCLGQKSVHSKSSSPDAHTTTDQLLYSDHDSQVSKYDREISEVGRQREEFSLPLFFYRSQSLLLPIASSAFMMYEREKILGRRERITCSTLASICELTTSFVVSRGTLRNDSTRPIGDIWRRAVDRGHGGATTRRPSPATRT